MTASDPVLDALWKRVTDDFADEKAHGAFLDYCRTNERLVEAAVRYRGMVGDRDRAAAAEKKLKAVALLAMTELESSRSPPVSARRPGSYVLIAMFLIATIGLLAYLSGSR